ncbi:ribose-phosphate pyrophosphokinase [Fusibacter ferrireducens]|uniref:ribose-phosphate diphosphokinase n=1 Tax=Fusibacter ferrireducens TaxID=2785058 RepID=A0ABR9ZXL4_9FIRM|nr:ribose-phosphate pyrophosphokinase [Fusibacter ferrireducens]MBF4694339.1 ribose-phosphate pyrophosphokinase [Fusibacter ferrireducens]
MKRQDYYQHVAYGELGIIAMGNCESLAQRINDYLVKMRQVCETETIQMPKTYLIKKQEIRFSNGEGKVFIEESVRGKDIYIVTDIGNYSCTYMMHGFENHKSPDDHIQDLKRVLSAMAGKARRVTVLMPLLYSSRQHSRKGRESLDCAMALQELEKLGVNDIITFDAHDPTIQNSIPLISFENLYPTLDIVKAFLTEESEAFQDPSKVLIISPDTGAMDRAIYYSSVLGSDIGLFYKRRDHSKVVKGKNPIVQHEYIGKDVKDNNILIVDDMIASGESIFDIAVELKKRAAGKVFIATTFALFTEGIDKFNKFYKEGYFDKVYTTNLSYIPESVKNTPWFEQVDMSEYISKVINRLNYDMSISDIMDASTGIRELIKFKNKVK